MQQSLYLIERLSALHRSMMRKISQKYSLQMVHIEVTVFLNSCNRYSNTVKALTEYLGQSKGSISQTVDFLEGKKIIKRTQDSSDKRVFHLGLTAKGSKIAEEASLIFSNLSKNNTSSSSLKLILKQLQESNGFKSFDICNTCRFNIKLSNSSSMCSLTKEKLSSLDVKKHCIEHQY